MKYHNCHRKSQRTKAKKVCNYWRNKSFVKKALNDRGWLVFVYPSKIISSKQYLGYGPHAMIHLQAKA